MSITPQPNEIQGFGAPDPQPKKSSRSGLSCAVIIALIVSAIAVCAGISFFIFQQAMVAVQASVPDIGTAIASSIGDMTQPIPGDASHFDPVASLPAVRKYAGGRGEELVSIEAYYVRSDGTMELTADYSPSPHIEYEFQRRLAEPPADAPPIGAGGANTGDWYRSVTVSLSKPGALVHTYSGNTTYTYTDQGMDRDESSPSNNPSTTSPDPSCSFADLWAIAVKHDAPSSAVATIKYQDSEFTFTIDGLSINLHFDAHCKLLS